MQKILVPTDFSSSSLKATTYAAEMAKKTGATVILQHVIEPAINMATMQKDSLGKKGVEKSREKLKGSLLSFSVIYPAVNVRPALTGGNVVTSILDFAAREGVDMIVMGTTGAGSLKKIFMGSVATGVLGKTTIPVLTVPAAYELREPEAMIYATNQFEKNKTLLTKWTNLAKLFKIPSHIVVFKDPEDEKIADLIYNQEQLNDYLKFLKENFSEIEFQGALLEGDDFETAIDSYSHKNNIGIITMITYPKTFFEKLFRKSITREMAFYSTIPILAIPAFR